MRTKITINALDFRVVDADSRTARMSGNRRYVVIYDGSVWMLAAYRHLGAYENVAWEIVAPVEGADVTAWCDCGWHEKREGSFYASVALDSHDRVTH